MSEEIDLGLGDLSVPGVAQFSAEKLEDKAPSERWLRALPLCPEGSGCGVKRKWDPLDQLER